MLQARIPLMMSSFSELGGRLLVIFDGHCGLCNRTVRWFLRLDRRDRLRFAASDSPKIAGLIARQRIDSPDAESGPGTILVVRDFGGPAEEILLRSDAGLAMLRELPRPWPAVAAVLRLIPRPIRDLGYGLIARRRHRIWERLEICPLPTPEEQDRFL